MALKKARIFERHGVAGLVLLAAICLPLIALMMQDVARELRLLRSATTDNLQWTLSQTEIEFQEFQRAADLIALGGASDFEALRTEFDIFYSRIGTLEASPAFAPLRARPEFNAALARLRDFLNAAVPAIDGTDAQLRAAVADWPPRLEAMRGNTRLLAISGLAYFANAAETRRNRIAQTLWRVAMLTAALLLTMGGTLIYLRHVSNKMRDRGEQLGAANARLGTILDTTLDGIVVADRFGRILQFNKAAECIFGRRADEVAHLRFARLLLPAHPEDGPLRLEALIGSGARTMTGLRADGSTFPIEIALSRAVAGREDIIIGSVRDISKRVAAERDLLAAHDDALAGEKAKSDFLAVMTHEIRTPLNGLLGNLGLLRDTRLSEDQARYTRNMAISGDILMRHVDAVMDLSRLEAQTAAPACQPVHLPDLLQDVVDGQSSTAVTRDTALDWRWVGTPVEWVATDPVPLSQILLNLVGNAIKFTEGGHVTIEAEAEDDPTDPEALTLELRVIDTGIGIAEGALDTIFEDFATIDTSYGRSTGGTGLGLGIARRLAHSLGGEIGAESTVGEGSVFWLRLPLTRANAIHPDREGAAAPPAPGGPALDILVVEDNDINRALAREMLRAMGHTVTVAPDGTAGVALAAERRFDLILMDIAMPAMDGLEATRRIRSGRGRSNRTPIVALSANVLARNQDRFAEAGMSDFLGKPFTQTSLGAVIARVTGADAPVPGPESAAAEPPDAVVARLRITLQEEMHALRDWLDGQPSDLDEIAARCHKIAGTAAAFGEIGLRDALIEIEEATKVGDRAALDRAIARYAARLDSSSPETDQADRRSGAV